MFTYGTKRVIRDLTKESEKQSIWSSDVHDISKQEKFAEGYKMALVCAKYEELYNECRKIDNIS